MYLLFVGSRAARLAEWSAADRKPPPGGHDSVAMCGEREL
jgi:hypothetical protein